MQLGAIDWAIMLVYFLFVLGIGFMLKRSIKTSSDFFLSGRSIPAWVAGLARVATSQGYAAGAWSESRRFMGTTTSNPMGIEWFGMAMGLGFVLSRGAQAEAVAAGLNVDAWWGAVLLLFGVGMLLLARRQAARIRTPRH